MKNIFRILGNDYDFNHDASLFINVPLEDQILHEDIIQISNKNNPSLCVDIGWYGGDFNFKTGYFRIVIIEGENWDEPLYSKTTRSVEQLEVYLKEFLTYLKT